MAVESFSADIGQIYSELISYENREGRRITAYIDAAAREPGERRWVVMAPKYGETKKNCLQLAYYLVANGFNVLRFDLTQHVGESEGEMVDFTMSGAVVDILASLDFLERRFAADNVVLVASSLSARCALRAAATDPRVARLVCLVGVVNLQHTLREVYQEDILGTFQEGRHWGVTDILGFNINGVTFCGSAVASHMHDLSGTLADADAIEVPMTYFYAERDLWVDAGEVRRVFGARKNCRLIPIEGAMHEIREKQNVAEFAFRQVVLACQGRLDAGAEPSPASVGTPDKQLVLAQNRRERERLRVALPESVDESAFWTRYLKRYEILEKADDYREYLELLGRLLGAFSPGCRVLDAGCGNGLFGLWLWMKTLRQRAPDAAQPALYVGIDLTEGGLADSVRKHAGAILDGVTAGGPAMASPPADRALAYSYLRLNFDDLRPEHPGGGLPFDDGTFDKVCCSLVISYLAEPARLLAELYRVLRPGGVLVFSSMKPFCDLSAIYRDFIGQQITETERESARGLLRAAGQIKLKEEKGAYTFFLPQELADLAVAAGFRSPEAHSSLGNQANVVKVLK